MTPKPHDGPLHRLLTTFHLFHAAETFRDQAKEAADKNLAHLDFLERLLVHEDALRHDRAVRAHVREAKLPVVKTIDAFDWAHPSSIPKHLIFNALNPPIR